jgi:hypothetical protein
MYGTSLFTRTGFDSGALTRLATIAHPMAEPGLYRLTVIRDGEEVVEHIVSVDPSSTASQLDIDLAALAPGGAARLARSQRPATTGGCCGDGSAPGVLRPGGYLQLMVGSGDREYAAVLRRVDRLDQKRPDEWDSRRLIPGDIVAGVLLRPGLYSLEDVGAGGTARVHVRYPESGERLTPSQPLTIEFAARSRVVEADPAQGIVLHAGKGSRFVVTLEKPEGPSERRGSAS